MKIDGVLQDDVFRYEGEVEAARGPSFFARRPINWRGSGKAVFLDMKGSGSTACGTGKGGNEL